MTSLVERYFEIHNSLLVKVLVSIKSGKYNNIGNTMEHK